MSKLSVSELANEFAVSAEDVVSLLRSMDIPIRSHMSMLTDDQVARIQIGRASCRERVCWIV